MIEMLTIVLLAGGTFVATSFDNLLLLVGIGIYILMNTGTDVAPGAAWSPAR